VKIAKPSLAKHCCREESIFRKKTQDINNVKTESYLPLHGTFSNNFKSRDFPENHLNFPIFAEYMTNCSIRLTSIVHMMTFHEHIQGFHFQGGKGMGHRVHSSIPLLLICPHPYSWPTPPRILANWFFSIFFSSCFCFLHISKNCEIKIDLNVNLITALNEIYPTHMLWACQVPSGIPFHLSHCPPLNLTFRSPPLQNLKMKPCIFSPSPNCFKI